MVDLSQRSGKPCTHCVDPSRPQQCAHDYRFLARSCGPAGWLAMLLIKVGDVETNPGPTTTREQVWICDICHIQIKKQISIRCNRIEHWVHLRCAGIHLAQYTDTWTCHLHKESRLTIHTYITSPYLPRPWSKSHPQHRVPRQPHRQTKDYKHHTSTDSQQ